MAESHDGSPSSRRDHQSQKDEECELQSDEPPPSPFYEELFCNGCTPASLVPLVPGALVSSWRSQSDLVRRGYLGKQERSHRKYFVLRAGSHTGPSRLEWYKSQDKFSAVEKSAGTAGLFSSNKQGVIYLRCCLGVSRIHSSRKGHTLTLYAKDHTLVLVMEHQQEQEDWYVAVRRLMEEEQRDEEHGEGAEEEEDDGYCTLPPAAFFKDVWSVTVKSRGAGSSKSLAGENRLCLTATSLIVVRVGAGNDPPSVTIPLLSVRRFGHLDGLFYLELGRSAPNGPGEIWMEAQDKGNQALAQHIHEAVRETIRALRVLPDFGRSPSSSKSQSRVPLVSKRCRLKYRDRPGSAGPLHPPAPRNHKDIHLNPQNPGDSSPVRVPQSSLPDGYMEMNHAGDAASPPQSWESAEEQEEEDEEVDKEQLGYMVMSPLVSHSVSQDDYVSMTSPGSSVSESDSAPLIHEHIPCFRLPTSIQLSETAGRRSKTTAGCSSQLQEAAGPEQGCATSDVLMIPATEGELEPLQPGPKSEQSGRRRWLSTCLPWCLQAEDG